ncbi:MAG: hypothetical protein HY291_10250 [Planctomycetes bacterium]|nr:hypothetical protein [Planctomycetota bacterium]
MAKTIEAQSKKIEEQEKTISTLKKTAPIGQSPAEKATQTPDRHGPTPSAPPPKKEGEHLRSWELPPITVTGNSNGELREEDRVGSYGQPRWTTRRRFLETRAYVAPEGTLQAENWYIIEVPRHGDTEVETQYEVEIGLPYRFQLDLYGVSHETGHVGLDKSLKWDQQKVELRWAWADWNKIPGNPTIYLEYIQNDGQPDHFESKLLFSGEAAPRWHWATNLVSETELGGDHVTTYEWTNGISYTVLDEKVSIGFETKLAYENNKFDRSRSGKPEILVGPSIQFRPLKQMHVDFAPLVGLTKGSARFKSLLIFGWEF